MKTADIQIEDMAVAGNVVLKRTARVTVEYGTENEVSEQSGKKPSNISKSDEPTTQKAEIKASRSGVITAKTAMEGASKSYSRRGSMVIERPSVDQADRNGAPKDSTNHTKSSLKTHKLDSLHHNDRPVNFGEVLPGIYRSSFPRTEDYSFYKKLGLKTVVTLVRKDFPAEYQPFLAENGIKHHVFDMEGTKKQTIPIHTMTAILRLVLDPRNSPVLLHCNHGRHRTGCVVAAIRKYYRWDLKYVLEEYRTYAEPKIRDCDIDYITTFNDSQLANLWEKDDRQTVDDRRPLIRRDERATFQYRFRRFYRNAILTFAVLVIWIYSGSHIIMANSDARPQPDA